MKSIKVESKNSDKGMTLNIYRVFVYMTAEEYVSQIWAAYYDVVANDPDEAWSIVQSDTSRYPVAVTFLARAEMRRDKIMESEAIPESLKHIEQENQKLIERDRENIRLNSELAKDKDNLKVALLESLRVLGKVVESEKIKEADTVTWALCRNLWSSIGVSKVMKKIEQEESEK